MQSVPVTTKVVSSNPAHGEVYLILHCDKVCQWFTADWWRKKMSILQVLWFTPPIKHDSHVTTQILLKVALNTINQSQPKKCWIIVIVSWEKLASLCYNKEPKEISCLENKPVTSLLFIYGGMSVWNVQVKYKGSVFGEMKRMDILPIN